MIVLKGLRVVEVSASGAAGLAAKYFADWGADVTILEPAGGSPLREQPVYYEIAGKRKSATWEWLSRGKRTVQVGPGTDVTHADVRAFCANADVCLIESELTESVLGLRPDEVETALAGNSTVILIVPFGLNGAYSSYKATDLGLTLGSGWIVRAAEREPLRPGGEVLWRSSGIYAFVAALVALRHLRQGGRPQFVQFSSSAAAAQVGITGAQWLLPPRPLSTVRPTFPYGQWRCKDGWISVEPFPLSQREMLFAMLELDDLLELPPATLDEMAEDIADRVQPWFDERTRQEIMDYAQTWRVSAAAVETISERFDCPQLAARGFWETEEFDGKQIRVPRVPMLIENVEPVHRDLVVESSSLPALRPTTRAASANPLTTLPFAGLRVLDLTWAWSGPSATNVLGALGAEVVRVESIQRFDPIRGSQDTSLDRWWDQGFIFLDTDNNKYSITLDLGRPEGKAVFEKLVVEADIVISNFTGRVMPQFGLSAERLRQINPKLIAVTLPGHGQGGPWENYAGNGLRLALLTGWAMITGYPDGEPMIPGAHADPLSGLHAVAAIEFALIRRERTGEGTEIEISQCELFDSLLAPEHISVQLGAPEPTRVGNKHAWMAPHNAYKAGGGDDWITIAVGQNVEFLALMRVLGKEEVSIDSRFGTVAGRKANEDELDRIVAQAVAPREVHALEKDLQAAGVMACRVIAAGDLVQEGTPLEDWGYFQTMDHRLVGKHLARTFPFRFTDIDVTHKKPAPTLGEDTHAILRSWIGLSDEEIERLETDQISGTVPVYI